MELFDIEALPDTTSETADYAAIDKLLEKLEEISPQAKDNAEHALLYGYSDHSPAKAPLAAIKHYVQNVFAAAESTGNVHTEDARRLAQQASSDRLDPDAAQVIAASYKVIREFDRLRGLLRFKPEPPDCYIARCAPDHFVLPLLADHFWQRFGNQSWAIIDDRRKLVLTGKNGKRPVLRQMDAKEKNQMADQENDEWEGLWKNYHHSINNEDRANPKLQKQFMPGRYWKYLTEFK